MRRTDPPASPVLDDHVGHEKDEGHQYEQSGATTDGCHVLLEEPLARTHPQSLGAWQGDPMHVTRLSTTPVKGLALHHPESIEINGTGAVGDRVFFLVDDADTLFSVAKTGSLFTLRADYDGGARVLRITEDDELLAEGHVEDGPVITANFFGFREVAGYLAPGPWNALFSERTGRSLRLVRAAEVNGGVDVEPLSLLGDASTAELASRAGVDAVDARRFRMLIEFSGTRPHEEDEWAGRWLRIGETVIEVGGPVQRCAGTTRNPVSGEVDLKTLALIGDYRGRQESIFGLGFNFGVYARTVVPGRIRVGDPVRLDIG